MGKYLILLIMFVSLDAYSYESICAKPENPAWDKIPEDAFAIDKVKIRVAELKKNFENESILAEEWLYETLIYIEGGALRQEVEYWRNKKNKENFEHAQKTFCNFFEKAYFVH